MRSDKITTQGGQSLGQNPFGALAELNLPAGKPGLPGLATPATRSDPIENPKSKIENSKSRGRVDIRRTTAGRGGKTVTLVTGFVGIGLPEKETLCQKMRSVCGCGGTVKDGEIEIQGDQREKIAAILAAAGFRPVFAGG